MLDWLLVLPLTTDSRPEGRRPIGSTDDEAALARFGYLVDRHLPRPLSLN